MSVVWSYEHSVETDARYAEAIWALWADVSGWGTWNADIEKIELRGPFANGSEITMTPAGQDPVELCLADVVEGVRFVDEAQIEGLVLRTMHLLDEVDGEDGDRVRVTYRMEISGPGAGEIGPQIGPEITADWPETVASLVAHAGRGKAGGAVTG